MALALETDLSFRFNNCQLLRATLSTPLPAGTTRAVFISWFWRTTDGPIDKSLLTFDKFPLTEASDRARLGSYFNGAVQGATTVGAAAGLQFPYPNESRALYMDENEWILVVSVLNYPSTGDDAHTWIAYQNSGTIVHRSPAPGQIDISLPAYPYIDIGGAFAISTMNSSLVQASNNNWRVGPQTVLINPPAIPTEADVTGWYNGRAYNSVAGNEGTARLVFTGEDLIDKILGETLVPTGGSATASFDTANNPTTFVIEPRDLTVTSGVAATLEAYGVHSGGPTWQWDEFIEGTPTAMSGQTARTLSLGTVTEADNGRTFRLRMNPGGSQKVSRTATLTVTGGVTPPVITGPSGAAGASSISHTVNEAQAGAGTWTATNSVGWSLTGTDAALLSISGGVVTKLSGNFDRETKSSYSFNVVNGSVSQAVTLTIANVNEAPVFAGSISLPALTAGVAMTPFNAASYFSDVDVGDTLAFSLVGAPGWMSINASTGVVTGTGTAGTTANVRVRATDAGALSVDSNAFTVQVNSAGVAPSVATQPTNQTATAGATAAFTYSFNNATSVQAERSTDGGSTWANVSGATLTSFTTPATTVSGGSANNGDRYRFTGTGSTSPPATTNAVQLTVNASGAATTASFLLTTDGTTPAANLSNLKFAFFDEATPNLWTAPKLKGNNGSTNGSGVMTLNITGVTGLSVGQVGSVVATNSDGTPGQGAALRFTFRCVAVS